MNKYNELMIKAEISKKAKKLKIKNKADIIQTHNIIYFYEHTIKKLKAKLNVSDNDFHINSWFRSKELNDVLKGSKTSDHLKGLAIDFHIGYGSQNHIFSKIIESKIQYKQLIYYPEQNFIHLSIEFPKINEKMRMQKLIKFKGINKYYPYIENKFERKDYGIS